MQLAFLMEMLGCRVTGLDPEDYDKHRRHTNGNGNDWARTCSGVSAPPVPSRCSGH